MKKKDKKMIIRLDIIGLCFIVGGLVIIETVGIGLGSIVQAVGIGILMAILVVKLLSRMDKK